MSVPGYYLLALSANDIPGISGYLNLTITGLSMIPASVISVLLMERLGRRPVGVMATLTFSVGLLVRVVLAIFVPDGKILFLVISHTFIIINEAYLSKSEEGSWRHSPSVLVCL